PAEDVALEVDDADAGAELGDVHDVVRVYVDLAGLVVAGPGLEVLAFGREDLEAVILPVGHVDPALVLPDAVYEHELAVTLSRLAPGELKGAVRAVLVDA